MLNHSGQLLVVGGVTRNVMLTADEEIVLLDVFKGEAGRERITSRAVYIVKGPFRGRCLSAPPFPVQGMP